MSRNMHSRMFKRHANLLTAGVPQNYRSPRAYPRRPDQGKLRFTRNGFSARASSSCAPIGIAGAAGQIYGLKQGKAGIILSPRNADAQQNDCIKRHRSHTTQASEGKPIARFSHKLCELKSCHQILANFVSLTTRRNSFISKEYLYHQCRGLHLQEWLIILANRPESLGNSHVNSQSTHTRSAADLSSPVAAVKNRPPPLLARQIPVHRLIEA